jgi:hypothetical protein
MTVWTNPWLVGIGASTASGLIVWFLTSFLFKKRDDAQYRRQVEAANEHLVNSLRPSISEESLPDVQVIAALRSANARKYHVREDDVWSVDAVLDELVREVMDSSFIGERIKKNYSQELVAAKIAYFDQLRQMEEQARNASGGEERERESSGWSVILALLAMGATLALVLQLTGTRTWVIVLTSVAVPTVFTVLASIVFVLVSNLGAKAKAEEEAEKEPPS